MRSKLFHHCLVAILLAFLMLPAVGQAVSYKIVDVIEVGPCRGGPVFRPIKWSPDGSKIAYFNNKTLMISDTLGNKSEIFKYDLTARQFEWISDTEIVFEQRNYNTKEPRTFKLSIVSLTGAETVLEKEDIPISVKPSFTPPKKTPNGVVYYYSDIRGDNKLHILSRPNDTKPLSAHENHYVTMVDTALSKISLDDMDTTILLPGRYSSVVVNRNYENIMTAGRHATGVVHDIQKNTVDTISAPESLNNDEILCGVADYEFNPQYNLITYMAACDERYGDHTTGLFICIYNLDTKENDIISPLTQSKFESSPVFSPNGNYLAFKAGGIGLCLAKLEVRE